MGEQHPASWQKQAQVPQACKAYTAKDSLLQKGRYAWLYVYCRSAGQEVAHIYRGLMVVTALTLCSM